MSIRINSTRSRNLKQPVCAIVAVFVTVMLSASFVQSTATIHWLGSQSVVA